MPLRQSFQMTRRLNSKPQRTDQQVQLRRIIRIAGAGIGVNSATFGFYRELGRSRTFGAQPGSTEFFRSSNRLSRKFPGEYAPEFFTLISSCNLFALSNVFLSRNRSGSVGCRFGPSATPVAEP